VQKWKKKKSTTKSSAVNKSPSKSPTKTKDNSGQRTRLASESENRRSRSRLTSESKRSNLESPIKSPSKSKSVIQLSSFSPGKSEMRKSRSTKSLGKLRNDTGPGALNDYANYVKSGMPYDYLLFFRFYQHSEQNNAKNSVSSLPDKRSGPNKHSGWHIFSKPNKRPGWISYWNSGKDLNFENLKISKRLGPCLISVCTLILDKKKLIPSRSTTFIGQTRVIKKFLYKSFF